jgi:LPXTG-motif cell wall-anchored protein
MYPSWSPDGSKIAFVLSNQVDTVVIYTMNADGTGLTNTNTSLLLGGFSWQPIPNAAPVLTVQNLSVDRGNSAVSDVLTGATDEEDLSPSNLTISSSPVHGTAVIESGKVKYTPNADYVGADQLTYRVCDSFVLDQKCSTKVLAITVSSTGAEPTPTPTPTPILNLNKIGSTTTTGGVTEYATSDHRPTFKGVASPNADITVEIHSDPIVLHATADSNGNWSVTPDQDIPAGTHHILITATSNGLSASISYVLSISNDLPSTGAASWPWAVIGVAALTGGALLKRRLT